MPPLQPARTPPRPPPLPPRAAALIRTAARPTGPGRVFFVRPKKLLASLLWDFYLATSCFVGSFMQFGTDPVAMEHSWYDTVCKKDFWNKLLDAGDARRPMTLARWDGKKAVDVGKGVKSGGKDLVVKITDSFLGIGDKVLRRGVDFKGLEEVHQILAADPEYVGKEALVSELILPPTKLVVSSKGFKSVHSLDIITMRTKAGVKVLTCLLWTDCDGWSSHYCHAGYLCDVMSEEVVGPAKWYSQHFADQENACLGLKLPGLRDACAKAIAAHEACDLGWLTTIGWDAMLTDDGAVFFEGNVAGQRTPRRMFLSSTNFAAFIGQLRGPGNPVPGK